MMDYNPVGWFEIYVEKMERAKTFYEKVFDVMLEEIPGIDIEMYAFPMREGVPGAPGALVKIESAQAGHNSVLIYFSCLDCSVEEKRVSEHGGKVHKSKFAIGLYGYISLVHDTEGNMIGLHSRA